MIVSGPVGNPESSWVQIRSPKTTNQSPNYKFLGLSLSTTSLVHAKITFRKQTFLIGLQPFHRESQSGRLQGRDKSQLSIIRHFIVLDFNNIHCTSSIVGMSEAEMRLWSPSPSPNQIPISSNSLAWDDIRSRILIIRTWIFFTNCSLSICFMKL